MFYNHASYQTGFDIWNADTGTWYGGYYGGYIPGAFRRQ